MVGEVCLLLCSVPVGDSCFCAVLPLVLTSVCREEQIELQTVKSWMWSVWLHRGNQWYCSERCSDRFPGIVYVRFSSIGRYVYAYYGYYGSRMYVYACFVNLQLSDGKRNTSIQVDINNIGCCMCRGTTSAGDRQK